MKIGYYRTVQGEDRKALDQKVNRLLGKGYPLYGNPYVARDSVGQEAFYQALVLDEKDLPEDEQ